MDQQFEKYHRYWKKFIDKVKYQFTPPVINKKLAGRIALIATFSGLVSIYRLYETVKVYLLLVLNEYLFFDYLLIRKLIFPIVVIIGSWKFLKVKKVGWYIISFWFYTVIMYNLYSLRWLGLESESGDSILGLLDAMYTISIEVLLFALLLYGGAQLAINQKEFRGEFGVHGTNRWKPLIWAVILFVFEEVIRSVGL